MSTDPRERTLDALLAAYRDAVPETDPSPEFMPGLWQRIDARRSGQWAFSQIARIFVTGAAALCVVMLLIVNLPASATLGMSYIEALDSDHQELVAYADIARADGDVQ